VFVTVLYSVDVTYLSFKFLKRVFVKLDVVFNITHNIKITVTHSTNKMVTRYF